MHEIKWQRLLSATIIILLLVSVLQNPPLSVRASTIIEAEIAALEQEIGDVDETITALNAQINANEQAIEITTGEIQRSREILLAAEADLDVQIDEMSKRIRYIFEIGNTSLLETLLSAQTIHDFVYQLDIIQTMLEFDRQQMQNLLDANEEIEQLITDLVTQEETLRQAIVDMAEDIEELNQRFAEMSVDLVEQYQALMAALMQERNIPITPAYPPPPITATQDDIILFAAILETEAFQNYDYMLAVATIILNRLLDPRWPNSLREVIFEPGQFEPTWTGRLDRSLSNGPSELSIEVARAALSGERHPMVRNFFFFLHAGSTNRSGVNVGGNLFFRQW